MIARLRDRIETGQARSLTYADLRTLQRFMVNLRARDVEQAQAYGIVTHFTPDTEILVLESSNYHKQLGVLIEQRPTEDFVQ